MYKSRIVLVFASLLVSELHAQAPADTTVELPAATVEAKRETVSARAPTRITTISPEDLAAIPARSVADALDRYSGLHVERFGPSGMATASIRGAGGKHTAVYLDGLIFSDPQSNQIDLSLIPLVLVESMEVIHGPGSAAGGAGSLGGSLTLNTVSPSDGHLARLGAEGGEYGQRRLGAVAAAAGGIVSVTAAGEISHYEGDYPYYNPSIIDPVESIRTGADRSLRTLYANASIGRSSHEVSISGWYNHVERGLPGPANAPPVDARQWDENLRLWVKSEHNADEWIADFAAVFHSADLRYMNAETSVDRTTETTTIDLAASAGRLIGSSTLARLGVNGGIDRTEAVSEERIAGFGELTWDNGTWLLYPSIRLESWASERKNYLALIPRFGANVKLPGGDHVRVKANVGRAYRTPSFLERYWEPGGNPDLAPESGWSADLGIHGSSGPSGDFEAEVTAFYTNLDDQIAWFPSFAGAGVQVWRPFNVGRVNSFGLELSGSHARPVGRGMLKVGANANLTRAIDRSDEAAASFGNQLRYVPIATAAVFAGLDVNPVSIGVSSRYVGQRYITSDESMTLDPYLVFDAQLRYRVEFMSTTSSFALQIENLFDEHYSVIRFYPMPPRQVSLRLQIDVTN